MKKLTTAPLEASINVDQYSQLIVGPNGYPQIKQEMLEPVSKVDYLGLVHDFTGLPFAERSGIVEHYGLSYDGTEIRDVHLELATRIGETGKQVEFAGLVAQAKARVLNG